MDQHTIDRLSDLRAARREIGDLSTEIARRAKQRVEDLKLKERSDLIDAEILRLLRENSIPTAYFPNGDQLQRTVNTHVEVEDWPTYMKWVTEQQNWQLVQQSPGKNAVVEHAQGLLDKLMGTLPGDDGATILDYFKPELGKELPPMPTIPGVRIVPRYAVKDAPKRRS